MGHDFEYILCTVASILGLLVVCGGFFGALVYSALKDYRKGRKNNEDCD